ncbi:MAG: LysE family translocator [Methylobacterium frigidaeris]
MEPSTLVAFALAFLVFAASPGPDNVAIMARTVSHGPASALAYGAGMTAGILIVLILAALGLALLAERAGGLMTVLRYGGGAYLIWTGFRLWTAAPVVPVAAVPAGRRGLAAAFATGLALNLGNPKMPLFYVALLPGVVGPSLTSAQVGLLAGIIVAVEIAVVGGHVVLAQRLRTVLRSPRAVRHANRAAGGALIGAGAAVIAAR